MSFRPRVPRPEIKGVGKGKLIASASDKDGNIIGLIQEP